MFYHPLKNENGDPCSVLWDEWFLDKIEEDNKKDKENRKIIHHHRSRFEKDIGYFADMIKNESYIKRQQIFNIFCTLEWKEWIDTVEKRIEGYILNPSMQKMSQTEEDTSTPMWETYFLVAVPIVKEDWIIQFGTK